MPVGFLASRVAQQWKGTWSFKDQMSLNVTLISFDEKEHFFFLSVQSYDLLSLLIENIIFPPLLPVWHFSNCLLQNRKQGRSWKLSALTYSLKGSFDSPKFLCSTLKIVSIFAVSQSVFSSHKRSTELQIEQIFSHFFVVFPSDLLLLFNSTSCRLCWVSWIFAFGLALTQQVHSSEWSWWK